MDTFRTHALAIQFHKDCQGLKLPVHARDQFERAILSIALNLGEGAAKPTPRDRKRFYYTALGSLRGVPTLLMLYGQDSQIKQADVLGAHLYKLCHSTL